VRRIHGWTIVLLACALTGCSAVRGAAVADEACPITAAPEPAFVPPAPYPAALPPDYKDRFWYGTATLWTMLPRDGAWGGLPQSQGGYFQKVFWWSAEYSIAGEPVPALVVTGRRLDGQSAPLVADRPTNAYGDFGQSMLVGVTVPAAGCWQITGHYRGYDLSFVVQVHP
jgi:hypothetical protein